MLKCKQCLLPSDFTLLITLFLMLINTGLGWILFFFFFFFPHLMTENCVCYQNESTCILQLGAGNFQLDEVLVLRKFVLLVKPQGCRSGA